MSRRGSNLSGRFAELTMLLVIGLTFVVSVTISAARSDVCRQQWRDERREPVRGTLHQRLRGGDCAAWLCRASQWNGWLWRRVVRCHPGRPAGGDGIRRRRAEDSRAARRATPHAGTRLSTAERRLLRHGRSRRLRAGRTQPRDVPCERRSHDRRRNRNLRQCQRLAAQPRCR